MIKLTLKDGSIREIESAMPASEIIKGIGMGLYKASCCVKINGEVKDLRTVIENDCDFEVCTFDSIEGKKAFWHTASHILAQAVKRLYPDTKLAIGPAIDNGFYYDFDIEKPFTPEELEKIEAEMKKIVKEGIPLEQFELSLQPMQSQSLRKWTNHIRLNSATSMLTRAKLFHSISRAIL